MPEDFEIPTGLPETAPEGQIPVAPAPEVEMVEFKNRDYEATVPRDLVDQFAQALNMDADRLRQAVQIGMDGTRLYESVNDEKDQLRKAWSEIERIKSERMAPAQAPIYQPPPQLRYPTRPSSDDVIGSVGWLAERFESIAPQLERLTTIEEMLANTSNTIYQSRRAQDEADERASALTAYADVAEQWKKEGWEMPPQRILERKLQQIPLSDDINATWHDIWNDVGMMVAGPDLIRRQRRQAVLASQQPTARITVPGGSAPMAPPRPSGVPQANGDDNAALEAEADLITRQLQGATAGQTVFPQR